MFNDPSSDVMVILTHVQCPFLGFDFSKADTVILFDGIIFIWIFILGTVEDQSIIDEAYLFSRCHCIGQTNPIIVYRLYTSKSWEGISVFTWENYDIFL